jgi:excinuclease UvrABC nuclease subunit
MEFNISLPEPKRIDLIIMSHPLFNFKNKSGIYIFYSKFGKCLYIGKSNDLYSRINSHLNYKSANAFTNDFNDFLNKFKSNFYNIVDIFEIDEKDLDMFETLLINKLNPYFNIQYNKNKNISDFKLLFEKISNEISGEQEYNIKQLREIL